MTDRVWHSIHQYLPTHDRAPTTPELMHELLCSLADVSEQALNTNRNTRNYAAYVSLADATDMLSAAILDLMNHYAPDTMPPREFIQDAITDVLVERGAPEDRVETLTHMVIVLTEEIGEIADAIQTASRKGLLLECADAIAVLYNMRVMAIARAGMTS